MGDALADTNVDGFDPWTQRARYALEQTVELAEWASAPAGALRVWIPIPRHDDMIQRVLMQQIEAPWDHRETRDANGNRYIYLEPANIRPERSQVILRFVVERFPYRGIPRELCLDGVATVRERSVSSGVRTGAEPASKETKGQVDASLDPRRYVGPLSRIPLTGRIKAFAEHAGKGLSSDAARIRAYYDFVIRTMKYAKYGTGWGRGDAAWACESKYGNCTDFHSVIIGMCRSQGIPARFIIGFSLPGDTTATSIKGYHCWAEAFDRDYGWVPMDASEAWKLKRYDAYYGRLPSDRVTYTIGRDLMLEPPQQAEPLNYIVYPYAERKGEPVGAVPWTLKSRRIPVDDAPPDSGNIRTRIAP